MKPRSSSRTGSSFLSRIAPTISGVMRSPQSGEAATFFMDSEAFRKPARNEVLRCRQHIDVTQFVPHRACPIETAGRTRGRAVHRDHQAERYAEQTSLARQAKSSNNEVVVIRIHFESHRPR